MNILFWNINKKSFKQDIVTLTKNSKVDILILCECTLTEVSICNALNCGLLKDEYFPLNISHKKFKVITRFDTKYITNFDKDFGGMSWTIYKFSLPKIPIFNIVATHLPSKIHWDESSQSFEAVNLMNAIRSYELKNGNSTIVVGDFNMNPYESGMTSSMGMHGMKDAILAKKKKRKIQGSYYDYFYNPMWNYLGDERNVSGTYFHRKSIHNNVMWNTFDQILLRPSLLNFYKFSGLKILTKIGKESLINKQTKEIDKKFSDHLPILANLNL